MQRSDQAQGRGLIETRNLFMGVMFLEKNDGFPFGRGEAGVDALGFRADFVEKALISLDVRAAGRADLHEAEAALIFGV